MLTMLFIGVEGISEKKYQPVPTLRSNKATGIMFENIRYKRL